MRKAEEDRQPTCCYCKYNVNHFFKSRKERDTHQEICTERSYYEKNEKQTHTIYSANKDRIEEMRKKKKELQSISGFSNAPDAQNYPELKYKYVMNEPFVGGTQ